MRARRGISQLSLFHVRHPQPGLLPTLCCAAKLIDLYRQLTAACSLPATFLAYTSGTYSPRGGRHLLRPLLLCEAIASAARRPGPGRAAQLAGLARGTAAPASLRPSSWCGKAQARMLTRAGTTVRLFARSPSFASSRS